MDDRIKELLMGKNTVLSKLATGFNQAPYIGEHLMPQVIVDDIALEIPDYAKDLFRVYETERAPRTEAKIMNPSTYGVKKLFLSEHSLADRLDKWEISASKKASRDLLKFSSRKVMEALTIGKEARIADLVQDVNSFPNGHSVELSGNDQWDDTNSDPIAQIDNAKEIISDAIGVYPNRMTLGHDSFVALKNHAKIKNAVFGKDQPGIPTIADLEKLFEMKIKVGRAKYATSPESPFYKIWEDNCILAYIPERNSNIHNPSFGYSFLHTGFPMMQEFWISENKKVKQVEGTTVSAVALLMGNAGYIIHDTNS